MTDELKHREEVESLVRVLVANGASDLNDLIGSCEGADPSLVASIMKELKVSPSSTPLALVGGRDTITPLPAADPSISQWWFSAESVEFISERINNGDPSKIRVLCIGAPTLVGALLARGVEAVLLDIDQDVVDMVNAAAKKVVAFLYDAANELPAEHVEKFSAVVIDPPWYEAAAMTFLKRSFDALRVGGELLMSLPPRLTRPGTDKFRADLISRALNVGAELLSLERGRLTYLVPRFEEAALKGIGFRGIPWRKADLLQVRKLGTSFDFVTTLEKRRIRVFARRPSEYRVFVSESSTLDPRLTIELLPSYSKTVSTRAHQGEIPELWTSEKVGARIGNLELVIDVLTTWGDSKVRTKEEAIKLLAEKYPQAGLALRAVNDMDQALSLWSRFAAQRPLRSDDDIAEANRLAVTEWATKPTAREFAQDADRFRSDYQRDRDRILWSGALRRLGHKTQLFPSEHDDETRQRLTHSIEVMQLASTIGASFGLYQDLIEAGSLAHDIGHTPFGHAGEFALNALLHALNDNLSFDHYEHGVDIIRWLEAPYYVSSGLSFHGLNLTPEVAECVLKHTFCHSGKGPSTEQLLAEGKHGGFVPDGYCHLEGQAVRIADKISYFVSDLEDGLRLGAINLQDLLRCHFFHRSPLVFRESSKVSLYESFVDQRRVIVKLLMQDVLESTNKRLTRTTPADIRKGSNYTVDHSAEMTSDVSEVWNKLQVARLHADRRVQAANLRSARIVTELVIMFAVFPHLLDEEFSNEHKRLNATDYMKYYVKRAGPSIRISTQLTSFLSVDRVIGKHKFDASGITVPIENLVQAKDFVAALTDSRARRLHSELLAT